MVLLIGGAKCIVQKSFSIKTSFFRFCFSFFRGHSRHKMDSASTKNDSFSGLWFFFKFLVNCDKCIVVKRLTKCLVLFEHLPGKAN